MEAVGTLSFQAESNNQHEGTKVELSPPPTAFSRTTVHPAIDPPHIITVTSKLKEALLIITTVETASCLKEIDRTTVETTSC